MSYEDLTKPNGKPEKRHVYKVKIKYNCFLLEVVKICKKLVEYGEFKIEVKSDHHHHDDHHHHHKSVKKDSDLEELTFNLVLILFADDYHCKQHSKTKNKTDNPLL